MKKLITALLITLFLGCISANTVKNDKNDIKIYQGDRLVKQLTLKEFYTIVEKAKLYEQMMASEEYGKVVMEYNKINPNEFKIIWYNENNEVVKELSFMFQGGDV